MGGLRLWVFLNRDGAQSGAFGAEIDRAMARRLAALEFFAFAAVAVGDAVAPRRRFRRGDGATVAFRPHEARCRRLVAARAPEHLHRVDDWLAEYSGREADLLRAIDARWPVGRADPAPPPSPLDSATSGIDRLRFNSF
jgi:hypothetical protein